MKLDNFIYSPATTPNANNYAHLRWTLCLGTYLLTLSLYAQSVGIGTISPHTSARLDIHDTTRGLLIPRLTTQQRNAIPNPAHTLIIFNIDSFWLEVYDTSTATWYVISQPLNCTAPLYVPAPSVPAASGNIGIGTLTPHPSAALEVWDTLRGILIPRLTAQQRNAIPNPAHGLIIFNVDSFWLEAYDTTTGKWYVVSRPRNCASPEYYPDSAPQPSSANVGIGTSSPHPSAILEVWDTLRGILIPRLTTQQRNTIANPAHGLIVFNIDSFWLEVYDTATSSWYILSSPVRCEHAITCNAVVSGPDSVCAGDTITYVATGCIDVNFLWNIPAGWILLSGQGSDTLVAIPDTSSGYVQVQPYTKCECCYGSPAILSVVADTAPACTPTISGPTSVCAGDTLQYTASGCPNVSYQWTIPPGWTILAGQGSNTLTVIANSTSGNVTVQACNQCGCTSPYSLSVTVDSAPACVPTISGPNLVCAGDTIQYTASGCSGVSYQWTVPPGWTILTGQGSATLTVIPDTADGNVSAQACNQCGCGNAISLSVTADSCIAFCLAIGGANDDYGTSIIQTSDGGYAIAGWTTSFGAGGNDVYVVKLNATGNLQWTRTIGGALNDNGQSIIQTSDSGYAIAGTASSFASIDFYMAKLDAAGNLQWTKLIRGDGIFGLADYGHSIIQTTDGGYAIAGYTNSRGAGGWDVYVVKLDGAGNLQWTRTIGGPGNDYGVSIIQTTDGGYAIAGYTTSFGAGLSDVYVVKLSSTGSLQWTKTIGGANNDYGWSIIQTTDDGYAIAGFTNSFGAGGADVYVVKLDAQGNLQWTKTIGGANDDYGRSIIQTSDGGYVIAGATRSFGAGGADVYVVKLDAQGNLQWTKTIGGANDDIGWSIIQTADGGYAIAGRTLSFGAGNNDIYVVKLDTHGNLVSCPGGCQVGTGGIVNTGGTTSSGGTVFFGGFTSSGGTPSSGGTLTNICP